MRRNELSSTVWYTLLALLVIALLSFGILGIQRSFTRNGWPFSVRRSRKARVTPTPRI